MFGSFGKLENLTRDVETARVGKPQDPSLMQALAALYLAKELADLKNYLDRITAASDAIPGGYAVKVVGVK